MSFCLGCGNRLGDPSADETGGPRSAPDPSTYTPKHLAEKILTQRAALEGERKQVTVLFVDVKRSVELSSQVDPEVWHGILDRFFAILAEGVHRFEGTVNQYTGDGIMALFGAPIAHEDHAQRACYAALHLREELRRYANQVRLDHGLSFAVRIGLNSGEVVVGKIGDDLRMDYTAQGLTVGLAARMQELAEPGTPYLGTGTAELVRGYFDLEDLGEAKVKGSRAPLPVHALIGVGSMRTRLDVSRARGFSRFVGRDIEVGMLESALERALAGQGQVVGVVAQAGMGKSRLCFEFLESCRSREIAVRTTTGVAHGKEVPFLPILDFYRDSFGITPEDDPLTARQKVAGALVLLDDELRDSFPLLFDFLGIRAPGADAPTSGASPDQQRQLTELLQRITLARSQAQPAVLLFEDLHWFDTGSETVLAALIDALAGTRTLLIANYRPEYRGDWMHRSHVQQVALQPLSDAAIEELLVDQLGVDPTLDELRPRILERTGGNPFFIEEVVRSLAEEGALAGARGYYQLAQPLAQIRIPASVQNVLAARIDRLLEAQKNVLQTASVIGAEFSEPLLAHVAGEISEILSGTLAELVSAEFLYERAIYPEREYAFRHPLTRDVAYESQLKGRRANIHAAVAKALEAAHPDKLDEKSAVLAQHWEGAGDALQAARWHRRAAEWVGLGNPHEWSHHFERVRALDLPQDAEADRLGLLARVQILAAGGRIGADPEYMEIVYREAQELVDRIDEPGARVQLLSAYGFYRQLGTDGTGGTADMERALQLADQGDDLSARVAVRYGLGAAYLTTGRSEEALRVTNEALELLRDDPERGSTELGFPSRVGMLFIKIGALQNMERISDAEAALEVLQRDARAHGHPVSSYFSANCETFVSLLVGDERRALAAAAEARTASERTENRVFCALAATNLARAHAANGNHEEALRESGLAVEMVRDANLSGMMTELTSSNHARIVVADDPADAKQVAAAALSGENRGGYQLTAELAIVLADLKLEGSGARLALEARLERLEEEFGVDSVTARAQIDEVRAALASAADDAAARDEHLRRAQSLYMEIGATGHAARLGRELDGA